jgi:hypothetical protein
MIFKCKHCNRDVKVPVECLGLDGECPYCSMAVKFGPPVLREPPSLFKKQLSCRYSPKIFLIALLVVAASLVCIFEPDSNTNSSRGASLRRYSDTQRWNKARVYVQAYLRGDPCVRIHLPTHNDAYSDGKGGSHYMVSGYLECQNVYGAMIRKRYVVRMDMKDLSLLELSLR